MSLDEPAPPVDAAQPTPTGELAPGDHLGKYEILQRLACGGMAEVFLARAKALSGFQKMFAVKRILPELSRQKRLIEMFLDEARIAATLEHPNVVATYDVGEADGSYYLAMEYLHGEDLRKLLETVATRGEHLPLEHVFYIVSAVAAGLHYAHTKVGFDGQPLHIVHRDVSPQNVIVTYDGGVKLVDFGIARAANREGEGTTAGTVKGKIAYMSPEQCRADPLDGRSDVFSLGIVLYELSVCRKLFTGKSNLEILKKIVERPVRPPTELRADLPPGLERIILRALAKSQAERYQTAGELQSDLETLAHELGLFVSAAGLARYMERLFGKKVEAWREAQAHGKSLADHLSALPVASEDGDPEELLRPADDSPSIERRAPVEPSRVAPRGRPAWLPFALGGALVVLAIALLAVALTGRRPSDTTPAPVARPTPVATPPPAAPTPPPASPARLVIRTDPPGALLLLDNKPLAAMTPTTLDDLSAGVEHVLTVRADGHREETRRFFLRPGEETVLDLVLAEEAKHVVHNPPRRPSSASNPPPAAARPSSEEQRPVAAARPAPAPTPLAPLPGKLVIAARPPCQVIVNGVPKGQSPLTLSLPAGAYRVVLFHAESARQKTLAVTLHAGETVRENVALDP